MIACKLHVVATAIVVLVAQSSHAGSTAKEDSSCDRSAAPASLLQKVFQKESKTTITQEQPLCNGISAQGRCWHLSGLGESCEATCSRNGRSFSFTVANPDDPLTPRLVGHSPTKTEPWGALECYSPERDDYHTANANAAKHIVNDISTWSHRSCQLACPCNEASVEPKYCTWKQPPACTSEFMYQGILYSGCADADSWHEKPWCQLHYQHVDNAIDQTQDWALCDYVCGGPEIEPTAPPDDGCVWTPASSCVPEFDYEDTHYVGCTDTDHETPWCSNTESYTGSWNHCAYSCPNNAGKVDDVNQAVNNDNTLCFWQPSQACPRSFEYKGVNHIGCTSEDHPTPWCSHHPVHQGSFSTCTRICNQPTTPNSASGQPCDRIESENDAIGLKATLDEAGYQTAALSTSPMDMKRFICRTVRKIGCEVVDLSGLMGFVPYYSGSLSQQTYGKLEAELRTICHAGGRWALPVREP